MLYWLKQGVHYSSDGCFKGAKYHNQAKYHSNLTSRPCWSLWVTFTLICSHMYGSRSSTRSLLVMPVSCPSGLASGFSCHLNGRNWNIVVNYSLLSISMHIWLTDPSLSMEGQNWHIRRHSLSLMAQGLDLVLLPVQQYCVQNYWHNDIIFYTYCWQNYETRQAIQ